MTDKPTEPMPEARDLALQIIHAAAGDPKRADEAAVLIDRFRAAGVEELIAVLKAAEEELRLIRMKDTAACYNPMLQTQSAIALSKYEDDES